MAALGAVVLFVTALAPLVRLIGTLYVLIRAHEATPPRHLRRVFAVGEKLRPWSMIDVFVFGVFVAYVNLGDVVTIGLAVGVYALLALPSSLSGWIPHSTARRFGKGSTTAARQTLHAAAPLALSGARRAVWSARRR